MADWEEEDFEPAPPVSKPTQPKSQWDDEDVEEEDVKESWEDEEEPEKPSKPSTEIAKVPETKSGGKGAGKKGKASEAKAISNKVDDEVLADPVAEKLRQQRLVEEADYISTTELFAKKDNEKSSNNFIPKSESDFFEYAELLSHKIRPFEKSYHYIGLLKDVMRHAMTSLKAADAKEVATTVSAIANEKLKAEKEANAGKKKTAAKKKQLHVDREDDLSAAAGGYNDVDDYDFM